MGSKVAIFGFRAEPDLQRLSRLKGLTGWRLFRHPTRPEWYMEGATPDSEIVGWGKELGYRPSPAARRAAKREIASFRHVLRHARFDVIGPETHGLGQALALSIELGTDILVLYSNTRVGADEGHHCASGRILESMLPGYDGNPYTVRDGAVVPSWKGGPRPPKGDIETYDHHIAGVMADAFFGVPDLMRVFLSYEEHLAREFVFIAGSDHAPTPESLAAQAKDELRSVSSRADKRQVVLRRFLRVCDRWLAPVLAKSLPQSSTRDASRAAAVAEACVGEVAALQLAVPGLDRRVERFLSEVLDYVRLVQRRQRSDRKPHALEGQATRLRWQWRAMALKLWLSSWSN